MRVREFRKGDQERIGAIHAGMGLDYRMPDLKGRLMRAKSVVEHDGRVIAAAALKIDPEAYLWVAPDAPPAVKWDAIRLLQRELARKAVRLGFERAVCYVPQCVGRFFAKRMLRLGWNPSRDGWKPWTCELRAKP